MSASRLVTIMCDAPNCGHWEDRGIADTAGAARAQLKGTGWRLAVSGSDRVMRDYCPRHARRGVRPPDVDSPQREDTHERGHHGGAGC